MVFRSLSYISAYVAKIACTNILIWTFFLFLSFNFTLCCSLNLSRSIVNVVILIVFLKLGILKIDLQHTRRYERTCNDGNIENCLRNHYHHHNIQYHKGRRWGVVSVVVAVIFIEWIVRILLIFLIHVRADDFICDNCFAIRSLVMVII